MEICLVTAGAENIRIEAWTTLRLRLVIQYRTCRIQGGASALLTVMLSVHDDVEENYARAICVMMIIAEDVHDNETRVSSCPDSGRASYPHIHGRHQSGS
jgi:hypothetical protein